MSASERPFGPVGPDRTADAPRPVADAKAGRRSVGRESLLDPESDEPLTQDAAKRLLHELRAYRIELERQNEELRRTQAELDQSRARYFDLYDLAPLGYLTLSAQGLVVEANLTAALLFGEARGAMVGQPISKYIVSADRESFHLLRSRLASTGEPQSCEVRLLKGGGGEVWAHVSASTSIANDGATELRIVMTPIDERKRAEEALRESQDRVQCAIDATLDGIWDWNITTGEVHFSAQWSRLLGYSPDEVPSRVEFFFTVLHPDDTAEVTRSLEEHFTGKAPMKQREVRLRAKSGEFRWFLDRGKVVTWSADGKPLRMVGTITDITERKRVEAALQASERELRLITNNMPSPIARVDRDCRYLFINEQYLPVFGLTWEMAVGRTIAEVIGPAAWREVEPRAMRALAGERVTYERVYVDPAGNRRPVQVHFVPDVDSQRNVVGFFIMSVDISERTKAESALKAARDLLEEAQSVARTGNWSIDLVTGETTWSRQLYRLHQRDPALGPPAVEEVLARYHPSDSPRLRAAMRKAMVDGNAYSVTSRVRVPNDGPRWLRCEGRARRNERGEVTALFGTTTDVTAEIEREEALRVARNQADSASRAKSEFLANMSHEIRTPLTAILGFAELLRDDGRMHGTPQQRAEAIETIQAAGRHLLTVINDILDLSKIEASKMSVERVDTPLVEILREAERLVRSTTAAKGVLVQTRLATPLPTHVRSDPTRLRQVLLNIVGNAAKFTDAGRVTVTARVTQREGRERLVIDVEDTGTGMTPEQTDVIFQPFGQADSTVTRKHGGSGLGLTITRRIVELMDGTVTLVRTAVGEGSCFRIDLPLERVAGSPTVISIDPLLAETPEAATMPGEAEGRADGTPLRGRVLLAEDVVDNQRLIAFYLRKAGATVEIADNGRIALEMFDRAAREGSPFDLLLTDMRMPEIDGYTLARTLRERGSSVAIVALTARTVAEDAGECLAAGCDDFSVKPIEADALLATCRRWIGMRGGCRECGA